MIANPYRDRLMSTPLTWRNWLANKLLIWAIGMGEGHVGRVIATSAWAQGWRPVAEPEPSTDELHARNVEASRKMRELLDGLRGAEAKA